MGQNLPPSSATGVTLGRARINVTALDISDQAVAYAKEQAQKAGVRLKLLVANFLHLPFKSEEFDFAFDFGCFHHVDVKERNTFIKGVYNVLKPKSVYLLVCFSDRNGPAWNHFTKGQIIELFEDRFEIDWIRHVSSVEGDDVTTYFYEVLMEKSTD